MIETLPRACTWAEAEGQLLRAVGISRYCYGFLASIPPTYPKFPWSGYRSGVFDDDRKIYDRDLAH